MVPWYPSPKEECSETKDIEDMGLSRKPTQRIRIGYTGGGSKIIPPSIQYFTDKTRTISRFRFNIKNGFGVTTDTLDIDFILPDHCEITDKTKTPFYRKFKDLLGYGGAYCTTQYALDGPNVAGVFQPDIRAYLTFDDPATTKMVFTFIFPPFEYTNDLVNFFWEFNFLTAQPLDPWATPVTLVQPNGILKNLGSTQPRGKFMLKNQDTGREFEIDLDDAAANVKLDLSDLKAKIEEDTRAEVKLNIAYEDDAALYIYIHYMKRFRAPNYLITDITTMRGCRHRTSLTVANGYCDLAIEDVVVGDKDYLFTSPPSELLRTAHLKPQLIIKKDDVIQICENCDMEYLSTREVPQVSKLAVDFTTCELTAEITSFGATVPSSVANFVRIFNFKF